MPVRGLIALRRKERLLQSEVDEDRLYAAVVQSVSDGPSSTKTLDGNKITGWKSGRPKRPVRIYRRGRP